MPKGKATDGHKESFSLEPGSKVNLINEQTSDRRVLIKMKDGTEVNADLKGQSELNITVGHESMDVFIEDL